MKEETKLQLSESMEYNEMKLNYQRFKEERVFYHQAVRQMAKSFLKSVPKHILIPVLNELKIIKRDWKIKEDLEQTYKLRNDDAKDYAKEITRLQEALKQFKEYQGDEHD